MSLAIQSLVIISTIIAFKTFSISAAEPTVIFLGPNGVRPVDGTSGSNNNGIVQPQAISNRDESSSGSKFDLYSISAAIKERLQERSAKKSGPRIIVIPQSQPSTTSNVQRSTYNPQTSFSSGQMPSYPSSFGNYGQGYTYGSSSPYGGASSYSPYASASSYSNSYAYPSSYPSYSSYPSSYPSYSPQQSYSSPSYSQPQTSSGGSYGSPYAAASTPYATYAYPSSSSLTNYLSSLYPFSSLMSRINPFLMYPQLAALTQSLYNY